MFVGKMLLMDRFLKSLFAFQEWHSKIKNALHMLLLKIIFDDT